MLPGRLTASSMLLGFTVSGGALAQQLSTQEVALAVLQKTIGWEEEEMSKVEKVYLCAACQARVFDDLGFRKC